MLGIIGHTGTVKMTSLTTACVLVGEQVILWLSGASEQGKGLGLEVGPPAQWPRPCTPWDYLYLCFKTT